MALMPVQGQVEGDFVLNLVPIDSDDNMDVVAGKIAYHSVNRRVAQQDRPLRVRFNGQVLPQDATPASAGVGPLDFLEAFYSGDPQ
ncbi:toluene-4-monooxygenase system B family protein [Mycobacterium sp.]|uniref:toluene-4-monooxygenase system B family protein n=1 Tax=Mycobacterium sp. TaxID=1785 RepID=UPI000CAA8A6B|nr:toluene-4-monooxygenase system B family protein [Mycobacterium sp.]PJE11655.1 MAG: toluene monooxygenase [Mycobacterium sp.]